jgi:hypothetical protein
MLWRNIVVSVLFGNLATIALAADIEGQGSGFSMYKARKLGEVLPYDVSRRVEVHRVMQRLGQLSLNPLFNKTVGEIETETLPGLPRLVLVDNDNDEIADYFIYYSDDGPSDLYGAFFGLVEGGPPAWIVFPVGPVIDDEKQFLYLFSHWVDQNSDGEVDLTVHEDVDMDDTGWPESGVSAWLADDDFDGLIDTAMHCAELQCTGIDADNGVLDLKLAFNQRGVTFRVGEEFPNAHFLNGLLHDLRRAMETE